jgi:hypothetical protein
MKHGIGVSVGTVVGVLVGVTVSVGVKVAVGDGVSDGVKESVVTFVVVGVTLRLLNLQDIRKKPHMEFKNVLIKVRLFKVILSLCVDIRN